MSPDAGQVGGVGRAGRAPGEPGPQRARRGEFAGELERRRAEVRSAATAELERARAAVESQESIAATGARLVRRYSPLERDAALYEVTTDAGAYRVVLGRDGSLTVFRA